jgi:altronate dehydratase
MTAFRREQGSVTMENIIWALAVIGIATIVVTAITTYVSNHSNQLLGL